MAKTPDMTPIRIGTHRRDAAILSSWYRICDLISARNIAATAPPSTGEMIQLAAIMLMEGQLTAAIPAAAMPAPITPPTTECVVDTGAPTHVARLTQSADEISAAIIAQMNT